MADCEVCGQDQNKDPMGDQLFHFLLRKGELQQIRELVPDNIKRKRIHCPLCGRMCCRYCGPKYDGGVCVECMKRLFPASKKKRRRGNPRRHNAMIYCNGEIFYGRIVTGAGEPIEATIPEAMRAGVSPEYIDSQYHGEREEGK